MKLMIEAWTVWMLAELAAVGELDGVRKLATLRRWVPAWKTRP